MSTDRTLRTGMVGFGMIFEETYRPFFERAHREGMFDRRFGDVSVELTAAASKTGSRAAAYRDRAAGRIHHFENFSGDASVEQMLASGVKAVCIATPDDRHFTAAKQALQAGAHVLIEKPSVLSLAELDELIQLADDRGVLAKVVYHKLLDPDHRKLRTLVADGVLQHVNHGYCSLLEPKSISSGQFSEWIVGRNPGTYVAVHYIKLIDFTFGGRLKTVTATGQRGIVGPRDGSTWDSTQLRLIYEYDDGREAAFDIHTSWVTPDNFPGYVEQEVQFRFDNGVWNGHSRKRGVELTVEGRTPYSLKTTINTHYNAESLEPWGERTQRGYGIEAIERFFREAAFVEFGGSTAERPQRLAAMNQLHYNDLRADRQTVAAVQALEAILEFQSRGEPDTVVRFDVREGSLVLHVPGSSAEARLYRSKSLNESTASKERNAASAQRQAPGLIPAEHLEKLQTRFHELIRVRSSDFVRELPAELPQLQPPWPGVTRRDGFAVPGMYGGFSYWLEGEGDASILIVESWSRIVGGSGQRHRIDANGYELVAEGFV